MRLVCRGFGFLAGLSLLLVLDDGCAFAVSAGDVALAQRYYHATKAVKCMKLGNRVSKQCRWRNE